MSLQTRLRKVGSVTLTADSAVMKTRHHATDTSVCGVERFGGHEDVDSLTIRVNERRRVERRTETQEGSKEGRE